MEYSDESYVWSSSLLVIERERKKKRKEFNCWRRKAPAENIKHLMRISVVWLSFGVGTWLLSAISIHHFRICLSNYKHKSKEEEQFTLPVI